MAWNCTCTYSYVLFRWLEILSWFGQCSDLSWLLHWVNPNPMIYLFHSSATASINPNVAQTDSKSLTTQMIHISRCMHNFGPFCTIMWLPELFDLASHPFIAENMNFKRPILWNKHLEYIHKGSWFQVNPWIIDRETAIWNWLKMNGKNGKGKVLGKI